MKQRDRFNSKSVGKQKWVKVELPGEARFLQLLKRHGLAKFETVAGMAKEGHLAGSQSSQGRVLDVVAVRVSQHDGLDAIPIRAHCPEPLRNARGPSPTSISMPALARLNQRRISPRAAGQNGELDGHRFEIPPHRSPRRHDATSRLDS